MSSEIIKEANVVENLISGDLFDIEKISDIVKSCIDKSIAKETYRSELVNKWIQTIVNNCLDELVLLEHPFKYIVTCVIMQKNGAGLHTTSSCLWDHKNDGSCVVRWENTSMYCVLSVFGLSV